MKTLKQHTNPYDMLPDGSHTVVKGKVALNWPGGIKQPFICPNCGVVTTFRLREIRRYFAEHEHVFEFRDGVYVEKTTIDHSLESAEDDTIEAVVCDRCQEEIVSNGQPAPRRKRGMKDNV